MSLRFVSSAALIMVLMPSLIGASNNQLTIRVRASELGRAPVIAGSLRITLTKLNGNLLDAQIENLSSEFVAYSPSLMLLVGADNEQLDVLGLSVAGSQYPAGDRRIAPYARLRQSYILSGSLKFPVRFYYGNTLLAIIAE